MIADAPPALLIRSWPAVLARTVWAAAAAALLVSAVVLFVEERRVWLELPAAVLAAVIAVAIGRHRCRFDHTGVEIDHGWRRSRRLWSTLAAVELVGERWRPAVHLRLHDGGTVPVIATWALRPGRRATVAADLRRIAEAHGVPVHESASRSG